MEINIYNEHPIVQLSVLNNQGSDTTYEKSDETAKVFPSDMNLNPTPLRAVFLKNQYFDTRWAFLFNSNGDHILQSAYLKPEDLIRTIINKPKDAAVKTDPGIVYFLAYNHDYENYYHWTLQCFPTLVLYAAVKDLFADVRLLLPDNIPSFALQYLKLQQIDIEKEVRFVPVQHNLLYLENVIYPSLLGGEFVFNPSRAALNFLQSFYAKRIGKPSPFGKTKKEIYYFSRLDSKNRSILNEKELIEMLRTKYDATVFTASELNVNGQAQTFAAADVIITPHGAALSNLIYCKPGASVIELMTDKYLNPCFASLALNTGISYTPLVFPGIASDGHQHTYRWKVDIDHLDKLLSKITALP